MPTITNPDGTTVDSANLRGGNDPYGDVENMDPRRLAADVAALNDSTTYTGTDGGLNPSRWDAGQPTDDDLVSAHRIDKFLARPAWHLDHTPPAAAAKYDEMNPHVERLLTLNDDAGAIDSAERAAIAAYDQEVDDAVAAGATPPKFQPIDRTAERVTIRAEAAAHYRRLRVIRRQYDALIIEHAPAWRALLVDTYDQHLPAVKKALTELEKARKAWLTRTSTIGRLNKLLDTQWEYPARSARKADLYNQARLGLEALGTILNSGHPDVDGSHVLAPLGIDPPAQVRRALSTQSIQHLAYLAKIEADEGYRHTAYTKPKGWTPPANGDGGGGGQVTKAEAAATKAKTKATAAKTKAGATGIDGVW